MRVGLIGVGRIGAMHARNLVTLPGCDALALFDLRPERSAAIAAELGARSRVVTRLEDLFNASDAVLIASSTDTHPEMIRRCIASGRPTFSEKPIATNLVEMSRLVEDVEASGVEVVVGFQRRFDPATAELHRRIRAGEVGDIYLVRSVGLDAEPPPDWGYLRTSGGIHRDLLIHDLDCVPWLVGQPVVEVYSSGSVLVDDEFAKADDIDNTAVMLRFASGAHALMAGARHNPRGYDCRIEVFGSRDSLAVGLDPRTPLESLEPDGPKPRDAYPGFPERFKRAYVNELKVFLEIAAGRAANPSPVRDSLTSLRLAEACEQSRRSGMPVRLDA